MSAIAKTRAAADEALPRRAFMWSAATALAAMAIGDGLGEWLARRRRRAPAASPTFEILGAAALAPGKALGFELPGGGGAGLLVHTREGLRAFRRACPHLGCPVMWSESAARIECPCHAATFDATSGSVLSGPPPRGLTNIELVHTGDRVFGLVG